MAEKRLLTRIVLTHDEYFALSTKTLKAGEVVLAKVGTTQAAGDVSEPIWMMKVGDGTSTVADCPWLVAPAADVYEWAKKASLDPNDLPAIPGDKLGITVTVTGEGNAITDASWDAAAKTLTLTKGETFLKASEFVDTKYSAGTKLELDGTTFNHSATTRTDGTDAAENAEFGKAITVLSSVESDETGHITAVKTKEITLPTPEEVTLPTVEDAEVAGQVIVEVDQTNGAISPVRKSIEVAHADGKIYLTIGGEKIGEGFSDSDFIKDGFLSKVEKDTENNEIVFTWNTDAGITETRIDIDELVEVYTGDGESVKVEDFVISVMENGIKTKHIEDKAVTLGKLSDDVQASLAKADSALQEHQDISGKADKVAGATANNFAGLDANGNLIDSGKKADDFATADHTHDFGVTKVTTTADNGLKVTPAAGTGEVTIDIDDTIVFVLDGGDASSLV